MAHEYAVKNVKNFEGHEGYGFNATLYRDGKRVAKVRDMASGGAYEWEWIDRESAKVKVETVDYNQEGTTYKGTPEEALFHAHVLTLPKELNKFADGRMDFVDPDCFVGNLIDEYESKKRLRSLCRKKTVVQTVEDPGNWLIFKHPYDEKIKAHIEKKYPEAVIMNETL